MDKKISKCIDLIKTLVSDIQGAPFPGGDMENELYSIWYDHAQRDATEAFEYLDENFEEKKEISKAINNLF